MGRMQWRWLAVAVISVMGSGEAIAAVVGGANVPGDAAVNDVVVVDQYAYLATDATSSGPEFSIFDVSAPAAPKLVGKLELGTSIKKIAIQDDRAYLATGSSSRELIIVDITNKTAPKLATSFNLPGNESGSAIDAVGSLVYFGTTFNQTGPELFIIDTAPATPVVLGSVETGGRVHDIDVAGHLAFLGTSRSSREVQVFNVANPAAIVEVGHYNLPTTVSVLGVDYHGGLLAVATSDKTTAADFFVFAVSDAGALNLRGSLDLGGQNSDVAIYGTAAFVSQSSKTGGLVLVNLADPANPQVLRQRGDELSASAVAVKDSLGLLATSTSWRKLQVVSTGIDLEPHLRDINGDGLITVVAVGDSNTNPPPDFRPGWPERADALVTNLAWRFINRAVPTTTAVRIEGKIDGYTQVTAALANDKPDAFVFGHGTNDADYGWDAPGIFAALNDLKAIADQAGVPVFGSLVARRYDNRPELNGVLDQLNNRLQHEWSRPMLLDFASPMVYPDDYINVVEIGPPGQDKRAAIAVHELNVPTAASSSAAGKSADLVASQWLGTPIAILPAILAGVKDTNGDGVAIIGCLGDSNTAANYTPGLVSWCERLGTLLSRTNKRTVNRAIAGTTAVRIPGSGDLTEQFQKALTINRVDAVIVAFGTNDAGYGYSADATMQAYQVAANTAQQAKVRFFVATTPRRFDRPELNTVIDSLNAKIRRGFSDVIDFARVAAYPADYQAAGIHMDASGQSRRANAALVKVW